MSFDNHLIEILIDLYTNMAAGWFGAILIFAPANVRKNKIKTALYTLIYNIVFGMFSIVAAYYLKLLL